MYVDEPVERRRGFLRWILVVIVLLLVVYVVLGQSLWFWLNIIEFGELFIRPIYFDILGGLILSAIILFRVDFMSRRSIIWWALRLLLRLIRERGFIEAVPLHYLDFKSFRMSIGRFVAWQITKVFIGLAFFRNIILGMTVYGIIQGWDIGLDKLWGVFSLPFVTPPPSELYAQDNVIPMVPALTLIIPPILGAIGVRLILIVGLTQLLRILTPSAGELSGGSQPIRWRIAVVEALVALGLFWAMFNLFFPSFIDYNTKVIIGALGALGVVFTIFAIWDHGKERRPSIISTRRITLRILAHNPLSWLDYGCADQHS